MTVHDIELAVHLQRPGFLLDVDLRLPGRGVSVLFGPSGSGKTTLLRCIAGLERVAGAIVRVGQEVWQDAGHWLPTHRRSLGYVFQDAALFPHLSVRQNLQFGQRRHPGRVNPDLARVIALLGIEALLERAPQDLSGGEKQRVAIARALAVEPRLLLMDEPLAGLDHARRQEILPYLDRLHENLAIPVVYVTHSIDELLRLGDNVVLLDKGRVTAAGPLASTLARLDLGSAAGFERGVVVTARVAAVPAEWGLVRVDFDGGSLWVRDQGLGAGHAVRVSVLARDVSLSLQRPEQTSIQNLLPGTIDAVGDVDEHPSQALVRIRLGEACLLASLTRRALATLQLQVGMPVWVQVKAAALLE